MNIKQSIFIVLLLVSLNVEAQSHRERIKALKVSFLTERLDLTEKEAQKFWPVYNEFEKNSSKIKYIKIKNIRMEIKETFDTMSEDRARELIEKYNEAENSLHQLWVEFSNKLTDMIPPKKIILLKIAEEDFKRKMIDEFKKRRKE